MRLLILAPTTESPSGIQRYTRTLARALNELLGEEEVHMISLLDSQGLAEHRPSVWVKSRFVWRAVRETLRFKPDLIICGHLNLAPVAWLVGTLLNGS